jgi:hypothetical protein
MELATGSSFDNERLTALNLAQQLLAGHELRWRDVLHAEPETPPARGWKMVAQEILQHHETAITPWEQGFLLSLRIKAHRLSDKQEAVLRNLCAKFGVQQWAVMP